MANQVLMQFYSAGGLYEFNGERTPLFSRRVEITRPSDQGYGGRKIVCTLSGFVEGCYHQQVIDRYKELLAVIKCNDATFTYKGDNSPAHDVIVSQKVYIDDYYEPTDWKTYQGDYNITFHYFEKPTYNSADLGIIVTYQSTVDSSIAYRCLQQGQGQSQSQQDNQPPLPQNACKVPTLYTFDPPPHWEANFHSNRSNWRGPAVTPSGQTISSQITIVLTGNLYDDDHDKLKKKIDALANAFKYDGILNYGGWSNNVRVEDVHIPRTFPRNHCEYQIILKYDSPGVVEFKCRKRAARLHKYPKITELPWCGEQRVQEFSTLGQVINYYFFIKAASIPLARSLLANEAALYIFPGGIEMEGGTEDQDDQEMSVTLSLSKYYKVPKILNIGGT